MSPKVTKVTLSSTESQLIELELKNLNGEGKDLLLKTTLLYFRSYHSRFFFFLTSYSTAPRVISSCIDNVELEVEEEEGSMWSGGN